MPGFAGVVGNKSLVDVSSGRESPCGAGSVPYCPAPGARQHKYYGWSGSKLYILLATMPHYGSGAITAAQNCNNATTDGWYDAPWDRHQPRRARASGPLQRLPVLVVPGYRYIIAFFDVASRTVQLAFIHPSNVPASLSALPPALPALVPQATIDGLIQLRLPH